MKCVTRFLIEIKKMDNLTFSLIKSYANMSRGNLSISMFVSMLRNHISHFMC